MRRLGIAAFDDRARFERASSMLRENNVSVTNVDVGQLQILDAFAAENYLRLTTDKRFCEGFARICNSMGKDIDWFNIIAKQSPATSNPRSTPDSRSTALNREAQQSLAYQAVLAVRECRGKQADTGGVLGLRQLSDSIGVPQEAVEQAVESLHALGSGMDLVKLPNGTKVIRSLPLELSGDQSQVLVACDAMGYVTIDLLNDNLNWQPERSQWALDSMVSTGLLWIDEQATPSQYWSPSVI